MMKKFHLAKKKRQVINEVLKSLPWRDRRRVIEAGAKYRKPATLEEIERLYQQVIAENKNKG
jgi:hypothetical protein